MKKFQIILALVLFCGIHHSMWANGTGKNHYAVPTNNEIKRVQENVNSLLGKSNIQLSENTILTLVVIVNKENKIQIWDTNVKSNMLRESIERALNGKRIQGPPFGKTSSYICPVSLIAES